jgi:hypothetical protein
MINCSAWHGQQIKTDPSTYNSSNTIDGSSSVPRVQPAVAMSTTPRGRCKCAGGSGNGARAACCFNPLRSLFRYAPTPPGGIAQHQQQGQEEEPSFFGYAMPNQGGGNGGRNRKKKKHRKPCVRSLGSFFRRKKKERKAARGAAAATDRRPTELTPASSMLTHPPGSPAPDKSHSQVVTPSMTQPPSPASIENTSVVNSPAVCGQGTAAGDA